MTVCDIVNIALGLEMKVNEHLLKVHECGENDPQVNNSTVHLNNFNLVFKKMKITIVPRLP